MNTIIVTARACVSSAAVIAMLVFSANANAATLWDFRGLADAPVGIIGGSPNALTFSVDSNTVTASAWSDTGPGGAFEGATVAREWTGLGSCNSAELGDCVSFPSSDSTHQVDNQGEQEWVLLVFDNQYVFDSLIHSPFGAADRDASYWIGNIDPNQNLAGLSYSDLTGIGFGDRIDTSADFGQGTVTINFGGATGNAILIGAAFGQNDDRLKIASVQASVVPIPASALLMLSGLIVLGFMRKRKDANPDLTNCQFA